MFVSKQPNQICKCIQVEEYYNLTKPDENRVNSNIDLLLNWGPIMFLPVTPFSAYLLSYPMIGLKYTLRIAVTLVFSGAFIRCIPSFMSAFNINIGNNDTLIFLHIAQILNAMAGPLVMSPPPKLSVIWFPQNQRTLATGIGVSAGTFGVCLSFLIGPFIHNVDALLYIDLLLCLIPFICVWAYFPVAPSKLPSKAAVNALLSTSMNQMKEKDQILLEPDKILKNQRGHHKLSFKQHFRHFVHELRALISNRSSIIIVMVAGLMSGGLSGWSGVFQDMLPSLKMTDEDVGLIGFILNVSLFSGAIIFGFVADNYLKKQLKMIIIAGMLVSCLILLLLFFILPSPFSAAPMIIIDKDDGNLKKCAILGTLVGAVGFIQGGVTTLAYELLAEISFPVTEGTASTLLVSLNNVACLVFVGIGNWLSTNYETTLILILCCLSVVGMFFVKEEYKRM